MSGAALKNREFKSFEFPLPPIPLWRAFNCITKYGSEEDEY
jgi:hypothetical protein